METKELLASLDKATDLQKLVSVLKQLIELLKDEKDNIIDGIDEAIELGRSNLNNTAINMRLLRSDFGKVNTRLDKIERKLAAIDTINKAVKRIEKYVYNELPEVIGEVINEEVAKGLKSTNDDIKSIKSMLETMLKKK